MPDQEPSIQHAEIHDDQEITAFLHESTESCVFHAPEWRQLLKSTTGGFPLYLLAMVGRKTVGYFPVFIRKTMYGTVANSLPLSGSYGGICLSRNLPPTEARRICRRLIEAILETAEREEWLSLTIVNPPKSRSTEAIMDYLKPDFIYDRFTQISDIQESIDYRPSVRNHLKQSMKFGLRSSSEIHAQSLSEFYEVYRSNMSFLDLQAKPFSFFEDIAKNLVPKGMAKFFFAYMDNCAGEESPERKMIAGLLLLYYRDIVMSHESVMLRNFKETQAMSFLIDLALKDSRDCGFRWFNWGASPSKESGVYRFKKAWGPVDVAYSYFTKIFKGIESISAIGIESLRRDFRWFYVAPYHAMTPPVT